MVKRSTGKIKNKYVVLYLVWALNNKYFRYIFYAISFLIKDMILKICNPIILNFKILKISNKFIKIVLNFHSPFHRISLSTYYKFQAFCYKIPLKGSLYLCTLFPHD